MIEGLENVLADSHGPGVTELRGVLQEVVAGDGEVGRLVGQQTLKADKVYRLTFEVNDVPRTLIVKTLNLPRAQRNRLVATRWLRAVGLDRRGPTLLGIAADRGGDAFWHVYEDFGDRTLNTVDPDWCRVEAAIDLVADLHIRFAEHPLLPEARMYGKDMGVTYYLTNLRDAIRGLKYLQSSTVHCDADQHVLVDRLLHRLYALYHDGPHRAEIMSEFGGPETLLHGDLWPKNILAVPTSDGSQTRLIDWDATGVGPVTYDLSTFLYRFSGEHRRWIAECYQRAVAALGWQMPPVNELSLLMETAEISRIANCLIWPCIEAVQSPAGWQFDALAEIETWFDAVEPALK